MKDLGEEQHLAAADLLALVQDSLTRAGLSRSAADAVARNVLATERRGHRRIGLGLLPHMIEHLRCGRVSGGAAPRLTDIAPGAITVDAGGGFACPAVALGLIDLIDRARQLGVATLAIHNAYPLASPASGFDRLAVAGLHGIAIVAGLTPCPNPNGTLRLEIAHRTHGLGASDPRLPGALHRTGADGGTVPPFEGPLGAPFRLSHRIIALRADLPVPTVSPLPPVADEKAGIAVPLGLLEKIITA
ncbi:Ldh family oxidoreductase [Nioella nitratireducens]|uniref:Ldh family oxidoreductase n=1 Tax=Nioella nitratireducens TaxID=1287720 RepID=UPI0008FD029D|nr:Ldh family oxidoreductase [Nioella nitratireducens]